MKTPTMHRIHQRYMQHTSKQQNVRRGAMRMDKSYIFIAYQFLQSIQHFHIKRLLCRDNIAFYATSPQSVNHFSGSKRKHNRRYQISIKSHNQIQQMGFSSSHMPLPDHFKYFYHITIYRFFCKPITNIMISHKKTQYNRMFQ